MNAEQQSHFLDNAEIPLRLAFQRSDGFPAVASLWYLWRDDALWMATRGDSFVVRCLERDHRCAFEVAGDAPPYRGVRGQAEVTIHRSGGADLLQQLMDRYLGATNRALREWLLERADDEVVLELRPRRTSSWDFSDRMEPLR